MIIYLSGAMQGASEALSREWRTRIKYAFHWHENAVQFFDPWDYWSFTDLDYDSKETMEVDLYHLRKSDIMIMETILNPKSIGTNCEMAIAHEHGIPIIGICDGSKELHDWQYGMVNKWFDMNAANQNGVDVYKEIADYVLHYYQL